MHFVRFVFVFFREITRLQSDKVECFDFLLNDRFNLICFHFYYFAKNIPIYLDVFGTICWSVFIFIPDKSNR